jgi:hypothetical protein
MRNDSFTSTFSVRNVLVTTAILASMSLAAGAFAQAPPPGVPPATPPANPNQRPPLGGPQVDPGAADSEKGFNGGKQGGKKGRAESGVIMDERMKDVGWMRTYESMKSTLSADTLKKTEAIKAVYEVSMKTWNDANADKMKSLREQMKGQKDEKDEKAGKAAAEQMKALRDTMPKMEETQKQIFALLSESEQATFKTKLEANEKQMRSLRSKDGSADAGTNADGKGKGGKGKGGKGAQGGPGGKPGDGQPPEGGSDKAPPLPPLPPPPPFDP